MVIFDLDFVYQLLYKGNILNNPKFSINKNKDRFLF